MGFDQSAESVTVQGKGSGCEEQKYSITKFMYGYLCSFMCVQPC